MSSEFWCYSVLITNEMLTQAVTKCSWSPSSLQPPSTAQSHEPRAFLRDKKQQPGSMQWSERYIHSAWREQSKQQNPSKTLMLFLKRRALPTPISVPLLLLISLFLSSDVISKKRCFGGQAAWQAAFCSEEQIPDPQKLLYGYQSAFCAHVGILQSYLGWRNQSLSYYTNCRSFKGNFMLTILFNLHIIQAN